MAGRENLLTSTEDYLKSLIAEFTQLPINDVSAPFQELGIDSFRVLQIIRKLEEEFGRLPKTLLFENFNIEDLTHYFVNNYEELLAKKFAFKEKQVAGIKAGTVYPPGNGRQEGNRNTAAERPASRTDPVLITEAGARAHPELGNLVAELFNRYKNEGSSSRGTRNIAPNLFIGSGRRGYFNYCRSKDILLVYAYTGPKDYFPVIAAELYQYCAANQFELNIFSSEQLESVNGVPFSATPFGVLSRIVNLKDFTLQGSKMRRLRYQVSKFGDAGTSKTVEYRNGSDKETDKAIARIIDQWCAPRTMVNPLIHIVKEEILAGTLSPEHRLFLTYLDEVLLNVIFISKLSPQENGYLMDLEFYPADMPLGGLEFAIVQMMRTLAEEGYDMLSLGGTYGCKLEPSSNADPELDKTLDFLREQHIFNDEGNLQFKNKFRPQHTPVFLCRPVGSYPDNVTDIIMMIADPAKLQEPGSPDRPEDENDQKVPPGNDPQPELMIEGMQRSAVLAEVGYNVLRIPDDQVEFDLKTDSWAQLELPAIRNHLKFLHSQLLQPANLDEALKDIFPFSYFALTASGRTAEHAFFKSWPEKGVVPQNLLFPTTIFNQIDNDFTPHELPHARVFQLDSGAFYKGDLAVDQLQQVVERDPASIAFVLIEVANNAAGGAAVSVQQIRKIKALLTRYGIPLIFEGTRILENTRFILEHEEEFSGMDSWEAARTLLAYGDGLIASLAKDFCVNKGGLIATNDAGLYANLRTLIAEEGIGLDIIDKRIIAHSLQNRDKIEAGGARRTASVRLIWNALKKYGIPVVQPAGGHCILIDVKQVPQFRQFDDPVASFLAWAFLNTGIRMGAHNAGMQQNTSINDLVRLAIPVGIKEKQAEEIAQRLIGLFEKMENIPELMPAETGMQGLGYIYAACRLIKYHNLSGNLVPKPTGIAPAGASLAAGGGAAPSRDIAVVGMAGRYPKAKNLSQLWENLAGGVDCIETIPDARFESRLGNEFSAKYRGGFIDGVDRFDSLFFNISPREAEHLDPQERLFLEVAWETIEDAGYYPETLAAAGAPRNIGVFVGAVWTLYQMLGVEEKLKGNDLNPSSHLWGIANRVSYAFNLSGPSISLDTACSSSLTAVYLACEAIRNGECSGAIVGGVNLDLHQSKIDINKGGGALSPDGVCRAFGEGANGYVAGEGVGAMFLKPLDRALADGDNIYGIIKGAAVNHGGKTSGFMVPSPHAQAKVVTAALENAQIDARNIGYIEAHGTGTELGDPIEISGLTSAFQKYGTGSRRCPVGSVKTNIGHLEAAAGIVGIQKVLLQMKHRKIVPSLHASGLNPFIDFENSPFYVSRSVEDWLPGIVDGAPVPLCAGVSSFGAGGSNAHVIVEHHNDGSYQQKAPPRQEENRKTGPAQLFPLSARTEGQLRAAAARLLAFIRKDLSSGTPFLQLRANDISHTLRVGRKPFDHRLVIIASTKAELAEKLAFYIDDKIDESVFAGRVKDSESLIRLLSRKEKEEFMKLLAQNGDLRKLAQCWVEGLFSDWREVTSSGTAKKVSLPTYPFADKRHWISAPSGNTGMRLQPAAAPHPLIDANQSTFERQVFKKTFHDKEFFIYDHLVSEVPTLPGVAYLDLARKAAELAAGRKVRKIRNILWLSPLTVNGSKPSEAFIELKANGSLVQFDVYSEKQDGQRQLHSQGRITYAGAAEMETEPEFIDLEGIRARCVKVIDGQDAYPRFRSLGLHLGPSFQVLQQVIQNENEILGSLKIPQVREGDFQDFLLHPSLMDGAGQTGMAAQLADTDGGEPGEIFVPYSFGEVEILHPVPQTCFAYVKKANDPGAKVTRTNILIVDESGKVLVKIKDSVGVPLVSVHEKSARKEAAEKLSDTEISRLYYAPVWERAPLVHLNGRPADDDLILFFENGDEWSSRLRERLLREGRQAPVITVKPGNSYQEEGAGVYTINPRNRTDFTRLLIALDKAGAGVRKICFAWPWDLSAGEEYTGLALKACLEPGVYAFLFLSQAIIEQKYKHTVQLQYLYGSAEGELQPHNDAMGAFIKTLHIEQPKLSVRMLEMQQELPGSDNALRAIEDEFALQDQSVVHLRYIAQERYVQKLRQYEFDPATGLAAGGGSPLKEKGVYLITGGVGGLGMVFAGYLAKQCKARLVLTGRSELKSVQKAKLEELRRLGAEVIYRRADVSDRNKVEELVAETKSQFGVINGVIHSAGVLRDAYLRNKTAEEMEAVFAPKLFGSLQLDAATKDEDLDFFVTFSSMAAVSGNIGQCDYAFANNFMDSFAHRREQLGKKGKRSGKSLSINWSIWREGGMRLDEQTEIFFRKNLGISPLRTDTGLAAFAAALGGEPTQLAVVEGDQEKMELAWGLRTEAPPTADDAGTIQAEAAEAPSSASASTAKAAGKETMAAVQEELSRIVMDFLKLDADDISVDKILMDLGFDSIGLATFANTINDRYQLDDITPVLFFEYPSIQDIAKFLCAEHKEEVLLRHRPAAASPADSTAPPVPRTEKAEAGLNGSAGTGKGWDSTALDSPEPSQTAPAGLSATRRFTEMPIAIVGMSGVMPQADDLEEYWEKLRNAENNMITLVPDDRWSWEEYYGNPFEEKNKTKIKWGGFMREVDKFDPHFWGISPREAAMIDPQQRIFLEVVWKAIEDAGHKVSDLSGTKTGIFVGAATRDYIDLMGALDVELDGYSGPGTSHAVLANRVSYLLNLHGPSAPLDTACSSSLVALHRAIESIHTGSSDMAIVGGVQVMLTPAGHISFGAAGMLSEDGKCKTFDERANGYVRGEGAGAILIKPLSRAEEDGDHVYAVIRATAENHGGKVTVLTAPNPAKQAELLVEAYEKAEMDPATVSYMECHGTGTSLGDPIEIQALKKAFSELYKRHNRDRAVKPHIGLTSAKTNIGHLETAAGIAGILKVLLSLKYGQIPALLHFEKLNPYIKLEGSPFYIVDKTRPWEPIPDKDGKPLPRRAGVSSFGFGGANVHVILEEYVSPENAPPSGFEGPYLIVLSAKNEERLKVYAGLMQAYAKDREFTLADFAYTLQVGRDAMAARLGFVADSTEQLIAGLGAYLNGKQFAERIFQGNTGQRKNTVADNVTLDTWFRDKNGARLLEAWVNGADLDWSKLYDNTKPKRMSLPAYPFAREKYWFKVPHPKQAGNVPPPAATVLHPLVHVNNSDLSRQNFSSRFGGEEFFIKDHQYQDQKTLPAAAYFEMARVAVELATPAWQKTGVLEFRQMICDRPITVNKDTEVNIALLYNDHEQLEFEIYTREGDLEFVHCAGQAAFVEVPAPAELSLEQIRGQMRQERSYPAELYTEYAGRKLNYGPSFETVKTIYYDEHQVLAHLRLPGCILESRQDYLLHPGLTDGLMQAAVCLLSGFNGLSQLSLPLSFSLESLTILSCCTEEMYAWLRWSDGADKTGLDKTGFMDVDLCDPQGNVCLTISGFSLAGSVTGLPAVSKPRQIQLAGLDEPSPTVGAPGTLAPASVPVSASAPASAPASVPVSASAPVSSPAPASSSPAPAERAEPEPKSAGKTAYSQTAVQKQLTESLADALYMSAAEVDPDKSFIDLGLDSIVGVEWLSAINKQYKMTIPASVVYDYPTIRELASFLHEEVNRDGNDRPAGQASLSLQQL